MSNTTGEGFKKRVGEIYSEMQTLLVKKNEDYSSASFSLGMSGCYVHIFDKVQRLINLVEKAKKGEAPKVAESLEDTLRDIIGYATIGLIILEEDDEIK